MKRLNTRRSIKRKCVTNGGNTADHNFNNLMSVWTVTGVSKKKNKKYKNELLLIRWWSTMANISNRLTQSSYLAWKPKITFNFAEYIARTNGKRSSSWSHAQMSHLSTLTQYIHAMRDNNSAHWFSRYNNYVHPNWTNWGSLSVKNGCVFLLLISFHYPKYKNWNESLGLPRRCVYDDNTIHKSTAPTPMHITEYLLLINNNVSICKCVKRFRAIIRERDAERQTHKCDRTVQVSFINWLLVVRARQWLFYVFALYYSCWLYSAAMCTQIHADVVQYIYAAIYVSHE